MEPRKATVALTYNGANATESIVPDLSSFSYIDVASGSSDSISVELTDRGRRWIGPWFPVKGDTLKPVIQTRNWNGDGQIQAFACGTFQVDDFSFSGGPPIRLSLEGLALPADSSFKTTQRTLTYEDATLQEIGQEIADRAGIALFYEADTINIKRIEQTYGVKITNRGTELKISGEDEAADRAGRAIEGLLLLAAKGETIDEQKVRYLINLVNTGNEDQVSKMAKDVVCVTAKGRPVKAKTIGQQNYLKAIEKNTITIGVGPAGTGKTYLAVAEAVAAFRAKTVNRIILTRPAVEAGERLGFLPGDLQNKVDPYLRPLYDALFDMLGPETYGKYLERGNIEVAPLAYMRGRTLDDSFIILDEAQNTTREQMKMFLTRLGFGSKIVITGDITQIDLPGDKVSGLKEAIRVLDGVEDIQICRLTPADVVRHVLVQRIVAAYDKYEKNRLPDERARTFTRKPDWKREKK